MIRRCRMCACIIARSNDTGLCRRCREMTEAVSEYYKAREGR